MTMQLLTFPVGVTIATLATMVGLGGGVLSGTLPGFSGWTQTCGRHNDVSGDSDCRHGVRRCFYHTATKNRFKTGAHVGGGGISRACFRRVVARRGELPVADLSGGPGLYGLRFGLRACERGLPIAIRERSLTACCGSVFMDTGHSFGAHWAPFGGCRRFSRTDPEKPSQIKNGRSYWSLPYRDDGKCYCRILTIHGGRKVVFRTDRLVRCYGSVVRRTDRTADCRQDPRTRL